MPASQRLAGVVDTSAWVEWLVGIFLYRTTELEIG